LNPAPSSFIVPDIVFVHGGPMSKNKNQILSNYKRLVDELLKETSDEKLVKDLMHKLGMQYTAEKVDRLTEVLAFNPRPEINQDL
jgi:hypothetical protein